MDVGGEFVGDLLQIDWLRAIALATIAVVVAALALPVLLRAAESILEPKAATQAWLAARLLARHNRAIADPQRWIRPACTSINDGVAATLRARSRCIASPDFVGRGARPAVRARRPREGAGRRRTRYRQAE